MKSIIFFLFCCSAATAFAGEPTYSVNTISLSLLINSNAIIRDYKVELDIKSPKKSVEIIKKAITILNKEGDEVAEFKEFYSGEINLKDFKGAIYNASGEKVASIKKSELKDFSTNWSNYVLFDGSYIKYYRPDYPQYPYTIVYEYTLQSKGSLYYEPFILQDRYKVAVEQASFAVTGEANAFRFKTNNLPKNTKYTQNENTHNWEFHHVLAEQYEPFMPSATTTDISIWVAPNEFEYDHTKGKMSTWKDLGKWSYDLSENRDILPPSVVEEMQNLRKSTPDERQLIEKIYQYVQKRCRYVYIGLGIGGFQPIEAQKVHEVGYGDCKALTNYTKALLKAANITAFPALIYAGEEKNAHSFSFNDFPSIGQANHVILCVPTAKDTVWLECTSNTLAPGFLGNFTDNRNALLITPQGGIMTKTPKYNAQQNLIQRNATLVLETNGNATVTSTTQYNGIEYSERLQTLEEVNKDQIKTFQTQFNNAIQVTNYSLSKVNTNQPILQEQAQFTAYNQTTIMGKRMFIPINLYKNNIYLPNNSGTRTQPFTLLQEKNINETTTIPIPKNYKIESLPQPLSLKNEFGEYDFSYTQTNEQIIIKRVLITKTGTFPSSQYNDFTAFLNEIIKGNNNKIVLIQQ